MNIYCTKGYTVQEQQLHTCQGSNQNATSHSLKISFVDCMYFLLFLDFFSVSEIFHIIVILSSVYEHITYFSMVYNIKNIANVVIFDEEV